MIDFSPRITPDQAARMREEIGPMEPLHCLGHAHCDDPATHYIQQVHNCTGAHVTVFPVCQRIINGIAQAVLDQALITCPHCHCGIPAKDYRVSVGKVAL